MRAAAVAAAPISYTHTNMQRCAVVRKKRLSWYGSLKNARIYTYKHVCIHVCLPACLCVCVIYVKCVWVVVCCCLLAFIIIFRLAAFSPSRNAVRHLPSPPLLYRDVPYSEPASLFACQTSTLVVVFALQHIRRYCTGTPNTYIH